MSRKTKPGKAKPKKSAVAGARGEAAPPYLAERIEAQRKQIIKVMGIVEACRMGSDSMLATMKGDEEPDFEGALAAAYDMLDAIAGELETISESPAPAATR